MAANEESGPGQRQLADYEKGLQHGPGLILWLVRPGTAAGLHQGHGERLARNPGGTWAGVVVDHRAVNGGFFHPRAWERGECLWPSTPSGDPFHTGSVLFGIELFCMERCLGPGMPARPPVDPR